MIDLTDKDLFQLIDFNNELQRHPVHQQAGDGVTYELYTNYQRDYQLHIHDKMKDWMYDEEKFKHLELYHLVKEFQGHPLEGVRPQDLNDELIKMATDLLKAIFVKGLSVCPDVIPEYTLVDIMTKDNILFSLIYEGIYLSAFIHDDGKPVLNPHPQLFENIYVGSEGEYLQPILTYRSIAIAQLFNLSMSNVLDELNRIYLDTINRNLNTFMMKKVFNRLFGLWKSFSELLQFVLDNYALVEQVKDNPVYYTLSFENTGYLTLKDTYSSQIEDLKSFTEEDLEKLKKHSIQVSELTNDFVEYYSFFYNKRELAN